MKQPTFVGTLRKVLTVLFCVALASLTLFAQETTGSIQGSITDASGAIVPGAKVEASSAILVRPITVVADGAGNYNFPALPSGNYTLTVSATGFATVKQENVPVAIGKIYKVDLQLKVGSVTESVVITSEAPIVDVSQSKVTTNVSAEVIDRTPKGRNFDSLIVMAPGARPEAKGGGYQIDGASGSENVFVIDGVDVTNLQTGTLPRAGQIPTEFVQEIQVKSSGFEAQYGGAVGGVVNAVVKSGTNEYHGDGGIYLAFDDLNASPRPSLRLNPVDDGKADYFRNYKDGYQLTNPGFSLGGPIIKDRLLFFTSYYPEHYRTKRNVTFLSNNFNNDYVSTTRTDFLTTKLSYNPFQRVSTYFTYIYSPTKVNGLLPGQQGTDAQASPWDQLGARAPSSSYTFGGDYTATNKLTFSVRGGFNYRNYKDYGIPRGTRYRFANANYRVVNGARVPLISAVDGTELPVPANLQGTAGNFTANNQQTVKDIQDRFNLSTDFNYIANLGGQHRFQGGYQLQRLHNDVNGGTWPDGYIFIYWNQLRVPVTVPASPTLRGKYGYYIDRQFATQGDVRSNNTGLYIQDSWQISRRLTLNLGVRTEREFVPSFRTDSGIASRAIEFGFGNKIAPRLGFAFDVFGDSKLKVYASYSEYYDLFKYELPRGSFGGDKWKDYVYKLEDPDFTKIKPGSTPGQLIEVVDWRIPSNDPSDNTIDPNLKPMKSRAVDAGFEYAFNQSFALTARYTNKHLIRTIEDVGVLTPQGEKYFIANPGFGLTADPKSFGAGVPVTPKAKREYNALEIGLNKRFSKNYQFFTSYTYSRLTGNYGGLASSDENGRTSPNVNRYFDLPFMSYDSKGKLVEGRLGTDRPHTFKFFGSYDLRSRLGVTTFSPTFYAYSGVPVSTEVLVISVPVFVNGRGDLGRTPFYSNTDMLVYHEFKPFNDERYKVRFEMNVFNLFNQTTVLDVSRRYDHPNDGGIHFDHEADFFKGFDYRALLTSQKLRLDPQFQQANSFQGPRSVRLGLKFIF